MSNIEADDIQVIEIPEDAVIMTRANALAPESEPEPGYPSGPMGAIMRFRFFVIRETIDRLDLVVQAEILDLSPDLMEIVTLLPPGTYDRQRLCDQLNSALAAHGWGSAYGTVE